MFDKRIIRRKVTTCVFFYFTKIFDFIYHCILIEKLRDIGFLCVDCAHAFFFCKRQTSRIPLHMSNPLSGTLNLVSTGLSSGFFIFCPLSSALREKCLKFITIIIYYYNYDYYCYNNNSNCV